jgi:hypothetical protein
MKRLNVFSYLQYFSATFFLVVAASITFPMQAQGQGGGKGNNSGPGNVIAWYDEALNTLFVNGDDTYKHILIEIRDTNAGVVALANATINGSSSFSSPITGQNPKLAVSAGGLIQINVATDEQVYDVQIDLGAGDDTLWIGLNIPADQPMASVGDLKIRGGRGNDYIGLPVQPLLVTGDLTIEAGDGADEVVLRDPLVVLGTTFLDGGKGNDTLRLSQNLYGQATVRNFRNIYFW